MPIKQSAKKALRQSKKANARNLRAKKTMKALVKQVRALAAEKKTEEIKALLPQLYKALDKGAKTGLIKKNTASRRKSRLTKLIKADKN